MTPHILISSAAYILTDHLISSEGTTCLQIMKNLTKRGIKFTAIGGYTSIKKPPKNIKILSACSIRAFPYDNLIKKYSAHLQYIIRSYLKASKILKTQKIDIIHHMFPAVYGQTFSLLAIRENFSQPFVFGPVSAHFTRRPLDEKIIGRATSVLHFKTISKCSHLIAITEQVKRIYSKLLGEDKISVIPLGVDTNLFRPNEERTKEEFEVLFTGSLYPLKGIEYLIKSMKHVICTQKRVKLRIVGEGPEKERLKSLAGKLGLKDKVIFEGFVPHDKIVKYYQNCDVFCFLTLGEPFGIAILEAMACGKPVIASKIGGPAEIVKDAETGFLVNPRDTEAIAERIIRLIKDGKLRKKMGRKARKIVVEKYSLEKISEEYHKLYRSLI